MGCAAMSKPAALAASLVDIRNVTLGHDKYVRLDIVIPAEQALLATEAFGWPTRINPVPVAIARLDPAKAASEPPNPANKPKERRKFENLDLPTQAGIVCNEPRFWRFLTEEAAYGADSEADAIEAVYALCRVTSRSQLDPEYTSGHLWIDLRDRYHAWKLAAEHVG